MDPGEALTQLSQLLDRKDERGRPWYTPEQVTHGVVFILLAGASPGLELPPAAQEYLGRLAAQLGVRPGAKPEQWAQTMADYFAANPLHPALRMELNGLAAQQPDGWVLLARAVAQRLTGEDPPPWLPTMKPAAPRVGAGPLAQNALKKNIGKSSGKKK